MHNTPWPATGTTQHLACCPPLAQIALKSSAEVGLDGGVFAFRHATSAHWRKSNRYINFKIQNALKNKKMTFLIRWNLRKTSVERIQKKMKL